MEYESKLAYTTVFPGKYESRSGNFTLYTSKYESKSNYQTMHNLIYTGVYFYALDVKVLYAWGKSDSGFVTDGYNTITLLNKQYPVDTNIL